MRRTPGGTLWPGNCVVAFAGSIVTVSEQDELVKMKEQVYTDPRPSSYFDRFHERAYPRARLGL